MPTGTFHRLPAARRDRLVNEAIAEFADRTYTEASLSQIARRAEIPKGSFYQYFEDKLDLYRWLLTEEAPRRKREFVGTAAMSGDFWVCLDTAIERGMAFLVEHPHLARLTAAAADPTAIVEVRGLHRAVCEAGIAELRGLVERGITSGDLPAELNATVATRLIAAVIGPGLTDVILEELGAELHEVLASDELRQRLDAERRQRLTREAVAFLRSGLCQPSQTKELR